MGKNKYGAQKVVVEGIEFDSKAEYKFYSLLVARKSNGSITDIELQPKFELLPAFTSSHGKKIKPITYTADFLVTYPSGDKEVIEIKGFEARDWPLRKKLFEYKYQELKLMVWAECPIKFGGGFILMDELKKLRSQEKRAKNGQAKAKEETKQARKRKGKG